MMWIELVRGEMSKYGKCDVCESSLGVNETVTNCIDTRYLRDARTISELHSLVQTTIAPVESTAKLAPVIAASA